MSEVDKLLADLDAEFGKKPRAKKPQPSTPTKDLKSWASSAAAQLARTRFSGQAEWRQFAEMMEANEQSKRMDWSPIWTPEARVTFITVQHCKCCCRSVEFIGGEYVRFKSSRQQATITRRAEVCTDLWHYRRDLPDLIEELHQEVGRCPQCIKDEKQIDEIWDSIIEKEQQLELDLQGIA